MSEEGVFQGDEISMVNALRRECAWSPGIVGAYVVRAERMAECWWFRRR